MNTGWLALFMAVSCSAATAQAPVGEVHATGSPQGASYRIDVPAHWNHRLVVFHHSTSGAPVSSNAGDALVPADGAFEYALAVQRAGRADNFVQQYVHHEGHCVFTPEQIGTAFRELTGWIDTGHRARGGLLP